LVLVTADAEEADAVAAYGMQVPLADTPAHRGAGPEALLAAVLE
jgi:hypothetical protein